MRAKAFSSLVGAAIAVVVFVFGVKAQDGVALVPFVVNNVEAAIKAERGDFFKVLYVGVAAVDTLKIPFGTSTSVTHRARDARNNAPVITNSRGRVSLNLPSQNYNTAEISLYAVNGRRVLRTSANATEASKSISRPSLAPGVYLLAVKGANGHSFTSRLIHSGGGLNINVSFGDNNMFSASPAVAGLSREAMADDTEEWTITVSEPGYADSVYTLTVVEGLNPLQEIELERIVEIIEIDTAYIPFTVNVASKVRAVLMDGSDAILSDFGTTVVEAGEMFSLEIPLNHSFMLVRGWTITVSADGYVDSTYTLNIVKGWNDEQVITLESSGVTTITANGVSFDMVFVDGGSFTMGCVDGRDNNVYLDCASSESPSHQVTLTNGYYIGKFPVTQALWVAIMDTNPSYFPGDLNRPVERVSWDDIVNYFIPALNALTGRTFRLPTEAEWEFAARGGNDSDGFIFSGGNIIGDVAWYTTNSGSTTQAVGGKDPNELGLFDMSGNVYEWVSDWWSSTAYAGRESGVTDPTGPATGSLRVIRGGSWNSYARGCRVSYRSGGTPDNRNNNLLGFRLVLSL